MLDRKLLMQRKETGCLYVVCRIVPLLMTIHLKFILVMWLNLGETLGEQSIQSLEDQQSCFMPTQRRRTN